jgi:hypothetical protein
MALSILSNLARIESLALMPKSGVCSAFHQVILRSASSKAAATKTNDDEAVNLYKQDMEGRYSPFKVKYFYYYFLALVICESAWT